MEAQLALSPGCDLTCEGCYTAEDRGGSAPRRERIAYLVDEVVACGAFAVHVIGKGEQFLSPAWASELLDVIEARPHVFFTIATHAMRIDDALAARIGRLGNLVLLVAIDGDEEIHDARRGAGSYRKVHEALARLRHHRAVFGFSCMVSAKSWRAITSPAVLREREDAGSVVGIYSRYFPLTGSSQDELALDADTLAAYRRRFDRAREDTRIGLLDLDDVEQHTGCHSRAGESIYIDGITGQVSPCLRVPFAPDDCRLGDANAPGRLAEILGHAYFVAYRSRSTSCPSWCGANLEAELGAVTKLVETHSSLPAPARLEAYAARARRRLPLLPPETRP
jgi:MoaA/NifB/PqqE/SkfB family radical SAM enzyme